MRIARLGFLCGFIAVLTFCGDRNARAANGTWINNASSTWSTTANWSGGTIADGVDFTADFSTIDISSDRTVTLDSSRTIGNLKFGDSNNNRNWILASSGGFILTLQVSSGTPTIDVDDSTTTISLVLAGTQGFTKTGAGTLTLSGANTYAGTTTINAGTVQIGNTSALGTSGLNVASGATLELAGFNISVANLAGAGVILQSVNNSPATLTVGSDNTSSTFSGSFNVSGGGSRNVNLTKTGTGTLTLSGGGSYSGVVSINGGALVQGSATALSSGNLTLNGGVLGLGNANLTRSLGTGSGQVQFTGSGGFAAYTADRTVNIGGAAGTLIWASTANFLAAGQTLILGASTADKTVTFVNPIDLNSGATTQSRTVQIDDGSATVDAVLSGVISKTGSGTTTLNKTGNGTLSLTAANTYVGGTTLGAGTLVVSNTSALGAASSTLTVNAGTLRLAIDGTVNTHNTTVGGSAVTFESDRATSGAGITHTLGSLSIGAQTLNVTKGGNVTSGTAGLGFGAVTLTGSAVFDPSADTLLTLGSVSGSGQSFTAQGSGDTTISGVIGTGSGSVTRGSGTGTLTLSGNNTFTGGLNVNGGTVLLNNAGALNSTTPNAVTMGGGTLKLNGINTTISGLSGSSGSVQNGHASTAARLTVNQSGNTSYGGTLVNGAAAALALTKIGNGELTLSGVNTYTGGTTIGTGTAGTGGTLKMGSGSALGTGGVDFAGGTLSGNDQTASLGTLTLTANSTLQLNSSATTSTLTFSSASYSGGVLTISGWTGTVHTPGSSPDAIKITAEPGLTFLQNVKFDGYNQGFVYWDSGTKELVPSNVVVPEPTHVALGIFGVMFAGVAGFRRWRAARAQA